MFKTPALSIMFPGLFAAGITLAVASPASAKVETFAQAGVWRAFAGRAEDGVPVCGLAVSSDDGRGVTIKWYSGANKLQVQVLRMTWAIPPGTQMGLAIRFDGDEPYVGTAFGHQNNPRMLTIDIESKATGQFLKDFAEARAMTIAFPSGNEKPWVARMDGSRSIATALVRCIGVLKDLPQPYAPLNATPMHPEYPSQAAIICGLAVGVLEAVFGPTRRSRSPPLMWRTRS
jgi:hypothetical protein